MVGDELVLGRCSRVRSDQVVGNGHKDQIVDMGGCEVVAGSHRYDHVADERTEVLELELELLIVFLSGRPGVCAADDVVADAADSEIAFTVASFGDSPLSRSFRIGMAEAIVLTASFQRTSPVAAVDMANANW